MAGSVSLFFLFTFLGTIGCMVAFWVLSRRVSPPGNDAQTSARPAHGTPEPSVFETFDSELLRDDSLSTISFWDRLLQRFDWVEILKRHLDEAGMAWSVGRLTMFMLLAGTATLGTVRMVPGVPGWVAYVAGAGAAAVPYMVVLRRKSLRLRRMEQQLPDALDTLARSLRAGHPIQNALEIVARESSAPLASELRKLGEARAMGMQLDTALENFASRVPVSEASEFAACIAMQSRTGGKLHEVLARLSDNMRESEALRMEVESIAAHGRMTGVILTFMPIGIGAVLTYTNPDQMAILWTSETGRNLIGAALVCLVLAQLVIRKIVDIRI